MTTREGRANSIPNAGTSRDAEIAALLGVDLIESIAIDLDLPEGATAPFSTERRACDALVLRMGALGYSMREARRGFPPDDPLAVYASFSRSLREGGPSPRVKGQDHSDAVSGAALAALLHWR
jgi:hypothetical protein